MTADTETRFWKRVARTDACWLWTGATTGYGYGQFYLGLGQRRVRAHRFSYELLVGPIPDGLVLDHLCRVRLCVNPAHLEPVTQRENILRGEGTSAHHARQTHCKRGHEFTPENTYVRRGMRTCRQCHRAKIRARRALARERRA
jgi:hypothetical protein